MSKLELTPDEVSQVCSVVAQAAGRHGSAEDPEFLAEAPLLAHKLPQRLRRFLIGFLREETPWGHCIVAGYPVDEDRIGPTPGHWKDRTLPSRALEEEIYLVLLGTLLGDLIGWSTQQDGHLVHDLMPIRGHEGEQLGTGSEQLLWWHTEDAFHPHRGDYLAMMCLRNPDRVPTTVAASTSLRLHPDQVRLLFEPRFVIRPDESHLPKNRAEADAPLSEEVASAYDRIARMQEAPERIPVLFGSPEAPYMRLDPYFMDPADDAASQAALDELMRQIDGNLEDVVLQPGEICFIDNWRAVHGRKPFQARHDGTDRWLKRINITRNLRASRAIRTGATERVLQ